MQLDIFMNEAAQDFLGWFIPVVAFVIIIEVIFSVTTPANIARGTEVAWANLKEWLVRVFMMPARTIFRRVPYIFAGLLCGLIVAGATELSRSSLKETFPDSTTLEAPMLIGCLQVAAFICFVMVGKTRERNY